MAKNTSNKMMGFNLIPSTMGAMKYQCLWRTWDEYYDNWCEGIAGLLHLRIEVG
jgi:hypothetical protein